MKKLILTVVALLSFAAAASAQQGNPPPTARPTVPNNNAPRSAFSAAGNSAGAALLPKGKIAVINTAAFQQQVLEFKAKLDTLNKQFETRVKEVQGLADRIQALENTIKTQSSALSATKVAEMTEQVESMKREYQRKGEDLQADANRAKDRAFEPITGKLGKFAEDYTAKRGIVLLIDLANATQAGAIVWFDGRTDITQDFINEYNKANPVPNAAPTPAPAKP
ncbi:MAG TPA: OmpH family outer membrane protein [Blastocatellia bacterium]|nr:OmpH family outer membrane protein [Blastocatellia bacterium]